MVVKYQAVRSVFIADYYLKDKRVMSCQYSFKSASFKFRTFACTTGIELPFYTYFRWRKKFICLVSVLFLDDEFKRLPSRALLTDC